LSLSDDASVIITGKILMGIEDHFLVVGVVEKNPGSAGKQNQNHL